MSHLKR